MEGFGSSFIEMVCWVPVWVYMMALFIFLVGATAFIIIKGQSKGKVYSARLFLLIYVILLLCITLVFREKSVQINCRLEPFRQCDINKPGLVTMTFEMLANIMLFIPIGLVLPYSFKKIKWRQTVLIGFAFSISIEVMQLVLRRGCFDIDDLIHNTLGCLIGVLLYMALVGFKRRLVRKNYN